MELYEGLLQRRSIRAFKPENISHEIIEELVGVSRFSPSWKNCQPVRYTLVEKAETIEALSRCVCGFEYNMNNIKNAPAVMVLSYVDKRSGFERDGSFSTSKGDRWSMFDSGIAALQFCLAAEEKGLGTCIIGVFEDDRVKELLELPEDQEAACLIIMGYPAGDMPTAPKRKEVEQLLKYK